MRGPKVGVAFAIFALSCVLLPGAGSPPPLAQTSSSASTSPPIQSEVPRVVDPIHTNGEPDIGIDPFGRFGMQLPHHHCDLAAMVRGVISSY